MDELGSMNSWFANPVYGRYWQHYQQAMAWYQRHRRAYRKALEAAYGPGCYHPRFPSSPQRYADWHDGEGGGTVPAEEEDSEDGEDEEDEESGSDSEIECDVSNMEITEELRQYFAQTEKHREELKKQQQLEAEQQDSYVPADRDLHQVSWQSRVAPPTERPGERRIAEMKKLYGEDAAKIQAMETAMQLTFDRNCDCKQPKYWPVIPLKL
ncbi:gem-associated protein 8 [Myripristis murdjan]|uniref:Gem (nuclear organelle) associated protein 8 n=1 Tax=Myripristis murdjan TaxID=586833 RepID=A0A667WMS6_9TELE|nr:gem-associated protein 8 [Myripristis murdjan]XP_029930271.1 gem-associated protein 8 [Myripristis murdjan]